MPHTKKTVLSDLTDNAHLFHSLSFFHTMELLSPTTTYWHINYWGSLRGSFLADLLSDIHSPQLPLTWLAEAVAWVHLENTSSLGSTVFQFSFWHRFLLISLFCWKSRCHLWFCPFLHNQYLTSQQVMSSFPQHTPRMQLSFLSSIHVAKSYIKPLYFLSWATEIDPFPLCLSCELFKSFSPKHLLQPC